MHTLQPRIDISLHIVAPVEKRDKVRREVIRPVFSLLDSGAMSKKCSFLTYDAIGEILELNHLAHVTDSFLEEYEEFFDS